MLIHSNLFCNIIVTDDTLPSPIPWIGNSVWGALSKRSGLKPYARIVTDLRDNSSRFYDLYSHSTPELMKLPIEWREFDKKSFRKLFLLRMLRPDRAAHALRIFVEEALVEVRPIYTFVVVVLTKHYY